MVMKRVEQGEDVFAEFQLQESSSPMPRAVIQQDNRARVSSIHHHHGFSMMKANPALVPQSPTQETLQIYDTLSQQDKGAVCILYQMTQLGAIRVL